MSTISPRLRENRNLGDLGPLAADIAERGLRHPLTVTRDGRLIIGARRLAACGIAGVDLVDCWRVTSIADAIALISWENADDLESGNAKYHLPATLAALAAQDYAMRELDWWPRTGVAGGGRDHRSELAAALSGPGEAGFVNAAQYRQMAGLALAAAGWQAGPGGYGRLRVTPAARRAAGEALAMLNHRDTPQVNVVYRQWRNGMPQTQPGMKPLTPAGVEHVISAITGFTSAISSTGIPDAGIAEDSLTEMDEALSVLIRTLSGYRKTIRQTR